MAILHHQRLLLSEGRRREGDEVHRHAQKQYGTPKKETTAGNHPQQHPRLDPHQGRRRQFPLRFLQRREQAPVRHQRGYDHLRRDGSRQGGPYRKDRQGGLRHRQALFRIGAYRTERRTRLRHARPQKRRLRRRQAPAAERPLGSKPAERPRTPRQSAQHHDGGDECVHLVLRTGEGQDQFRRRFRQVRTRYFTLRFTRKIHPFHSSGRTKTLYGVHPEADP